MILEKSILLYASLSLRDQYLITVRPSLVREGPFGGLNYFKRPFLIEKFSTRLVNKKKICVRIHSWGSTITPNEEDLVFDLVRREKSLIQLVLDSPRDRVRHKG